MSRPQTYLIIAAVSLLTHLPGITQPLFDHHSWAQTLRASLSMNYVEDGMNLFKPRYDYKMLDKHENAPQFPLYSYGAALLYKVFGTHDFLGRILSAVFAALSAVFLYLLAAKFFDNKTAFLSAIVYSFIPIRIFFMRVFMPDAMALFCLIAGFYYFLRWLEDGRFLPHGLAAAPLLALVPLLKIAYLWLLLALVIHVLKTKGPGFVKQGGFFVFTFIFLFMVVGWYGRINYGAEKSAGFINQITREMAIFNEWTDPGFWATHFLSRFPELLTTYAGLLFFLTGMAQIWKKRIFFPMAWFGATVFFILMCGSYGRVHQYANLPFAPVNALFIAVGIVILYEKWKSKKSLAILLLVLVFSIPVHAALRIRHWYRQDQTWVLEAKNVLDSIAPEKDLIFVNSPAQPFYLYHLNRDGWSVHLKNHGLQNFEQALSEGAKYLFVPVGEPHLDWESVKPKFSGRFKQVFSGSDFEIYDLGARP